MDHSRFVPIFPAHAIERCCATIGFDQSLPAKLFDRVKQEQDALLKSLGFARGPEPLGFAFDVATGRVMEALPGNRPTVYSTSDQATTITFLDNQISLQTFRYVRWANFRALIEKHLMPGISAFTNVVSIASIQLEYNDRFMWTGTWEDFTVSELIDRESPMISRKAAAAREQWHSHSGWFETVEENLKRLVNIRVDVVTAQMPNSPIAKPSVGIYTSLRDSVNQSTAGNAPSQILETRVSAVLENQHTDLKEILRTIITNSAASVIGL